MARILITRAEPEASATAAQVAASGHSVLKFPLTRTEPLKSGLQALSEDGSMIAVATSARAVGVVISAGFSAWIVRHRWAVVGRRAGDLLAEAGATLIAPPSHDVSGLAAALSTVTDPLLYLAAEDRKPTLEQRFPSMRTIPIYRAAALGGFDQEAARALRTGPPDGALVYSARGAVLLAEAVEKAGFTGDLRSMTWLCLSDDVAANAPEWARDGVVVSKAPTQEALFAALNAVLQPKAD